MLSRIQIDSFKRHAPTVFPLKSPPLYLPCSALGREHHVSQEHTGLCWAVIILLRRMFVGSMPVRVLLLMSSMRCWIFSACSKDDMRGFVEGRRAATFRDRAAMHVHTILHTLSPVWTFLNFDKPTHLRSYGWNHFCSWGGFSTSSKDAPPLMVSHTTPQSLSVQRRMMCSRFMKSWNWENISLDLLTEKDLGDKPEAPTETHLLLVFTH